MAKTCKEWHHICNAECCRGFFIDGNIKKIGNTLKIATKPLSQDMKLYYELHGVRIAHGMMTMHPEGYEVMANGKIFVHLRCKGLTEDLQCKFHGTKDQPIICSTPGENTYHNIPKNVVVTPNCLYKYKLEAEKNEMAK